MRVILLTHGGAELVLEELAKLDNVEIAGVFIEAVITPRRPFAEKIRRSIRYDGLFETIKKPFQAFGLGKAGSGTSEFHTQDPVSGTIETARRLGVKVYEVDNYHSETSLDLIAKTSADLGVIFGTNIIKENVFSLPKLGSINLHQGLAPYYRGGPPVFWELFNGEKEVGITAHFVASKVDTGDVILQKTVPLEYDFSLGTNFEDFIHNFQTGLRQESARLVAESVKLIETGSVVRKPQDISVGKRYRLPVKKEKDELRRRLRMQKPAR